MTLLLGPSSHSSSAWYMNYGCCSAIPFPLHCFLGGFSRLLLQTQTCSQPKIRHISSCIHSAEGIEFCPDPKVGILYEICSLYLLKADRVRVRRVFNLSDRAEGVVNQSQSAVRLQRSNRTALSINLESVRYQSPLLHFTR